VELWLAKIKDCPHFLIKDSGQVISYNTSGYKLQFKPIKHKLNLPDMQLVQCKGSKLSGLFYASYSLITSDLVFGLEKYLRDKYKQIIDVSRFVLNGLCIIRIYFYQKRITDIEAFKKDILSFINKPSNDYLSFGLFKEKEFLREDLDFKIQTQWESIVYTSELF
jgi:hypothetical protein